jgi:Holliday junction DNA helicase RuvA
MFDYIKGKVIARHPTHLVVETGVIGYLLHVTLNSFDQFEEGKEELVYTWLQVQEDAHRLWGFKEPAEREVFLYLISISGIGPNTARLILSGMTPEECRQAILTDNELAFKQVKGVGPKTAKRVILELKDKIHKTLEDPTAFKSGVAHHRALEEALAALVTLGFLKSHAEKTLSQIVREQGRDIPTETLVRTALRMLSA